jgi:dTMP kinase
MNVIGTLDRIATGGLKPDLTILLDIDVETGLMRNRGANKVDRLELEDIEFHKRVRNGYHELAKREPERIKIIDASGTMEEILQKIIGAVSTVPGLS